MEILTSKKFIRKISRRIPVIGVTRPNSAFLALENIFGIREGIVALFKQS